MTRRLGTASALLLALTWASAVSAQIDNQTPEQLAEVGFDQRLGASLPLDLVFWDEEGQMVRLDDYFGDKPVILAPVYYDCPMLCGLVLKGLTATLKTLSLQAGQDFEVVAVSFGKGETPEMATHRKEISLRQYGRHGAEEGWHFLTGSEEGIRRFTEAIGFRYAWDEKAQQYAHAAGIIVATPDGKIARYFFGLEYPPKFVRLAMVEAADEKLGNLMDEVLLYCFHYDPTTGQYSATIMNIVRLAGAVTVLAILTFLTLMRLREKRLATP